MKPTEKAVARKPCALVLLTWSKGAATRQDGPLAIDFESHNTVTELNAERGALLDWCKEDFEESGDQHYMVASFPDTSNLSKHDLFIYPDNHAGLKGLLATANKVGVFDFGIILPSGGKRKSSDGPVVVKRPRSKVATAKAPAKKAPAKKAPATTPVVRAKRAPAKAVAKKVTAPTPTPRAANLKARLAAKGAKSTAQKELDALDTANAS